MTNFNNQLPTDIPVNVIVPSTMGSTKPEKTSLFDSRNYLDFSIPEGQTSREITIRLLPVNPETQEMFQIVHLHNIPVHKELNPNKSGKKAYMCLSASNTGIDHAKYGSKCPVCEAQKAIWKQWHDETDDTKKKELAKEAGALNIREYCIVRCIERGKEEDGPKFWRIPLRQDQTDAYHKILLLGETRRKEGEEAGQEINIYSLYQGRDLKITFTDGNGAPTVVDKSISTPITKDNDLLIKWYYDEKKWSDVFSTKPYDYLKIAFDGDIPWYDKANNIWVSKSEFDGIKSEQENTANAAIKQAEAQFTAEIPVIPVVTLPKQEIPVAPMQTPEPSIFTSVDPDDDLPF